MWCKDNVKDMSLQVLYKNKADHIMEKNAGE